MHYSFSSGEVENIHIASRSVLPTCSLWLQKLRPQK